MKTLKRILSVILVASMIFTSNAMITLAENENQVVSSEETTATVGTNEATVGANARGALDSVATASDAEDTAEENIEVDDDFIGPRLVEPEEDEITTANENTDTENAEAKNIDADDDNVAASAEAGASETTKAVTEATAGETETTVAENETTVDVTETTAAETETTVGASESSVGANAETVGANARGALDSVATASDAEEDDNAKTDEEIKIASASTAEIKTNDEETFGATDTIYWATTGSMYNKKLYFSNTAITVSDISETSILDSGSIPEDNPDARPWDPYVYTVEILNTIKPKSIRYWFDGVNEITGLSYLDTSNTTNMSWAFGSCKVKNLDLSTFNTSNVTNMNAMFQQASDIETLNLSGWDTSKVTDMSSMFSNLQKITNLDVSHFNTSSVTNMQGMFNDCSKLTSLNLSNFDTSSVTDMSGMFNYCIGLTSLDLSYWNVSNVTSMSNMFNHCEALTNISFSNWSTTSSLTSTDSMFRDCKGLTNLNLKNLDTSSVTMMFDMFRGCSNLVTLDLSSFNTSNVVRMAQMFEDCTHLTTIFASRHFVTTGIIRDGNTAGMFTNCTALTGGKGTTLATIGDVIIHKPYAKIDGGTSDPGLFTGAPEPIYWALVGTVVGAPGTLYISNSNISRTDVIHSGIIVNAFTMDIDCPWYPYNTTTIEILDNIKPASMAYWFCYRNATSIIGLDKVDTSYVTDMSHLFENSNLITAVDLSSFDTSKVTNMENMFSGCTSLATVTVSKDFVTTAVTDSDDMFSGCTALTGGKGSTLATIGDGLVDKTYAKIDKGTSEPGLFTAVPEYVLPRDWQNTYINAGYARTSIQTITFEKAPAAAPTGAAATLDIANSNGLKLYVIQNGSYYDLVIYATKEKTIYAPEDSSNLFEGHIDNDHLKEIRNLNYLDTSNVTNMQNMFLQCGALESLDVSNFNTSNVTNMDGLFRRCRSLQTLDLSSFDTSNVTNMSWMFESDMKLKTINFSSFDTSNVTNMSYMFYVCTNLLYLDLSNFDTHNVTNMKSMFDTCSLLTFIGTDDSKFVVTGANTDDMFTECFRLIGQEETQCYYDSSSDEKQRAHIDHAYTGNPGYFSEIPRIFVYDRDTGKRIATIDYQKTDLGTIVDPPKPTKDGYYFKEWFASSQPEWDIATDPLPGSVIMDVIWTTTPPTPTTKTVKSIDINRTPRRTTYTIGDIINPTGLVIKVTYDDNTTETITYNDKTKNDFTFKPSLNTPLTSDDKEVVITYGNKTVTFKIEVEKKSDPTPSNPGGSGGSSDPTKGPMGDLTKNPEYANLIDPLNPVLPVDQTLNKTNDLPQENLIYDTKLIDALKSFPENANPTKANVEDTDGNKGYGEWLNVPRTTTWYFLTGNLKPEDVATMSAKESGGFLRSGWYNLGWKGENKWYHFNTGGVMDIGWYTENNLIYYLEADLQDNWYGKAVTGTKVIDGITYNFGTNGALIP